MPCNAPGGIKEYTEYVKAGHYIPGAVLDPDLGIEYEIFSKRVSLPSIPSPALFPSTPSLAPPPRHPLPGLAPGTAASA